MNKKLISIIFALLAAIFYSINIPLSKILLQEIDPIYMAAFLYFGAGIGMLIYSKIFSKEKEEPKLTRKELPYTIGMIVLDIIAPISLMLGLSTASSANASLLNNFEIVATSIIALVFFKEKISRKMWYAIFLITLSSVLLSFEGVESFQFSYGSIYILIACVCWGFENNCTRMLSSKSTTEIVILKGIFSGLGSLIAALITHEQFTSIIYVLYALLLGFISYGLSIFFYVKAQSVLGAAKTSAYYAVAPFIGSFLSFVIFREELSKNYLIALIIMIMGTIVVIMDTVIINHSHMHKHVIIHTHDGTTHEHVIVHEHPHNHMFNRENQHLHKHILKE